MPGSIAGYAVLFRLCNVNFAGIANPNDEAETEAFRASEGLNASRIQVKVKTHERSPRQYPQALCVFLPAQDPFSHGYHHPVIYIFGMGI